MIIACIFLVSCQENQIKKCTVSGRVIGRNSTTIYLTNAIERPDNLITKISITDSTFSFELDANPEQAYWLIFEDEFRSTDGLHPIIFFPDKKKINLTLYDLKRIDQNKIYGGKLNQQFAAFSAEMKEMFDPKMKPYNDSLKLLKTMNNYYSEEYKKLSKQSKKTSCKDSLVVIYRRIDGLGDNAFTEPVKSINRRIDSILKEKRTWIYNYYEKNPTLVSYYLLLDELSLGYNIGPYYEKYSDLSRIKDILKTLSDKFPYHPYSSRSKDLVAVYDKIRVGGEFIDFTLPDLDGDTITLSELIKDKISLIDLWATWCAPCISTSRSMIPVYNEFKDSGFIVIGVANEFDNTDRLLKTLEKEKFPWLNLVELDSKHRIWDKYGVKEAGGTFLVDKDGKILAISPTVDEVRSILSEKLN
jgi:peroxiredoxin